jgi:hypothetical protein
MSIAFRRMTRALPVNVSLSPSASNATAVPADLIKPSYNAFAVFNPNSCVVGLRGTSRAQGQAVPTTPLIAQADGLDWLFPPGFLGVFSTQYPYFMSAIALAFPAYPDLPAESGLVPLRLWYGIGE